MHSQKEVSYKLIDLVRDLDIIIQGDENCLITGVATIQQAQPGHVTFLANPSYRKYLSATRASAVILAPEEAALCQCVAIISANPYYTYARVARIFAQPKSITLGAHPTAVLGAYSSIDSTASIGAHVVIGAHVKIGPRVVIGAGTVIEDHVEVDAETILAPNVSLCHHTKIGKRCHIASGAVIGSDGFGFANQHQIWHKVPQLGAVRIGDDVDIGANTTIDRGAMEDTIIENGVKLDNLIQIGHNVRIGENTIIAGCTAIAGSTTIGKNCMIGGAACFAGHIEVVDNVMITGMTAVTKSIRESGIYSSGIVGAVPNHEFRKNNARFHRMENLMERVKKLEVALKTLQVSDDNKT